MAFRSFGAAARASHCPGVLPAALAARASHALHVGWFGDHGRTVPLILCSGCGARGTAKVAKLGTPCPAIEGQAIPRNAPYRKHARLAAKSLHPSRHDVPLHGVRPLRPFVFRPLPPDFADERMEEEGRSLAPQSVPPPARLVRPPSPPHAHGVREPAVPDVQVQEGPQDEAEEAVLFNSHLGFDED